MAGEKLKQDKDPRHRQNTDEDLFGILGDSQEKLHGHVVGGMHRRDLHRLIDRVRRVVEDAQQQDHEDGADAAQGDKAEAVVGAFLVAAGGG